MFTGRKPVSPTAGLNLHDLLELPYGEARRIIRQKIDPMWGKIFGGPEMFTYDVKVTVSRTTVTEYTYTVEAPDEVTAEELGGHAYETGSATTYQKETSDFEDIDYIQVTQK